MEVFYERVTAKRLTQYNDENELEERFYPQIERTEVDFDEESGRETFTSYWISLTGDGENIYFLDEIKALTFAVQHRYNIIRGMNQKG